MGDPLGSSCVSSQKQNREGVVGALSGQYRATVESSPECGGDPGWNMLLPSLEPETYRSWAKALAIAPSATSKIKKFRKKIKI
ncbi:hypothetical protein DVH24_030028 [Malus domestica]|uniref:Uncharacterized protein n=1 Tax=Malus domestica TaxID=3750 RepID=A0A498I0A6_MALDO|nr:hypothetical protein DVH24_030028 [Malus domestica]